MYVVRAYTSLSRIIYDLHSCQCHNVCVCSTCSIAVWTDDTELKWENFYSFRFDMDVAVCALCGSLYTHRTSKIQHFELELNFFGVDVCLTCVRHAVFVTKRHKKLFQNQIPILRMNKFIIFIFVSAYRPNRLTFHIIFHFSLSPFFSLLSSVPAFYVGRVLWQQFISWHTIDWASSIDLSRQLLLCEVQRLILRKKSEWTSLLNGEEWNCEPQINQVGSIFERCKSQILIFYSFSYHNFSAWTNGRTKWTMNG